jgi:polysaccharide biosynthesis protein PslG
MHHSWFTSFHRVRMWLAILGLTLTFTLPSGFTTTLAQANQRCFSETGFCISGRVRTFWEQNGGLPVFGFPITAQREEVIEGRPFQVQWFERTRFELHPENTQPYDVLLGRVGADRLNQQGRDWFQFPKATPREGCQFFTETGHNVCGAILRTWRASGLEFDGRKGKSVEESLALFGLPLSDRQTETIDGKMFTVQWFERARFELHPENTRPYDVLLGLLGNETTNSLLHPAEEE